MTGELQPVLKPLVIKIVNEDGAATVTHAESNLLDLQSLFVNKYNYNLNLLGKTGGFNRVSGSIEESDVNILSLAILNPTDTYLSANGSSFSFSDINQDFGSGLIKTFRRYCEAITTTEAEYDSNQNFTGLTNSFIEIIFKNLPEDSNNFGENLKLNQIVTENINGKTKLISITGKTFDGIKISLMANNGFLNLGVGDSFWIEYITRNEGVISAPKVTGLNIPIENSDAVNLDFLNQKTEYIYDLIENQGSFVAPTNIRWQGTRAVITDDDGQSITIPDMSVIDKRSSIVGIALTNPEIDESGLTEEEVNLSYQIRVFVSGIVKDVVDSWNTPKGNVYAGANGILVEDPPISGRIIKVGQKYGNRDLLISIQDYGFSF